MSKLTTIKERKQKQADKFINDFINQYIEQCYLTEPEEMPIYVIQDKGKNFTQIHVSKTTFDADERLRKMIKEHSKKNLTVKRDHNPQVDNIKFSVQKNLDHVTRMVQNVLEEIPEVIYQKINYNETTEYQQRKKIFENLPDSKQIKFDIRFKNED